MTKKAKKAAKSNGNSAVGHRAGSRRARAHALILSMGPKAENQKVIAAIKAKLKVKPATATSWFYQMRGKKSDEHKAQAAK